MARAALFVLVSVATGLLVYLLAAPHFLASSTTPTTHSATATPTTGSAGDLSSSGSSSPPGNFNPSENPVSSAPQVDVPRSREQRQHDDLEAQRGPFYDWIRKNMQSALVGWQPSAADPATLDLYLAQNDPNLVPMLLQQLVAPYASRYGFNHVRFYLPNPSSVDHWRLDSEATVDTNGVWNSFRK